MQNELSCPLLQYNPSFPLPDPSTSFFSLIQPLSCLSNLHDLLCMCIYFCPILHHNTSYNCILMWPKTHYPVLYRHLLLLSLASLSPSPALSLSSPISAHRIYLSPSPSPCPTSLPSFSPCESCLLLPTAHTVAPLCMLSLPLHAPRTAPYHSIPLSQLLDYWALHLNRHHYPHVYLARFWVSPY